MEEKGTTGNPSLIKRVWTFEIRGSTFQLDAQGNPPLRHNSPGLTLWKMVGTVEQADAVEAAIREAGARVRRYSEDQSPEQEAERLQLLGRGE